MIKKELFPFSTTWLDHQGIMLSEVSHTEKDKLHMISLIHRNLKKKEKKK